MQRRALHLSLLAGLLAVSGLVAAQTERTLTLKTQTETLTLERTEIERWLSTHSTSPRAARPVTSARACDRARSR